MSMGMGDLDALPANVLVAVFEKVDVASLCCLAATCRQLRLFVERDVLPCLSSVHLLRDTCLNERGVASLLAKNTTIRSLKLDCSTLVNDSGIEYLIKPSLEELALYNCETMSSELLVKIGQRCRCLRSLELELGWQDDRPGHHGHGHGYGYAASYGHGDHRQHYQSTGPGFSRGLELLLEGCGLLESLSLSFAGSCFDSDALAAIPRLRAGSIQALEIGLLAERDAKQLLEVVRIDNTTRIGGNFNNNNRPMNRPITARTVFHSGYENLQRLSLSLDRISDSLVTMISLRLPTLTDLDLRDEPTEEPMLAFDLTNAGVQQVGGCRFLKRLSLVRKQDWFQAYFKRVSDLGIFLMAESCENLDSIRLGGFSRITDAGCRALLHTSKKLQSFEVLHMTQITDLAFHDLSVSSLSLEFVGLSSCGLLSDDAVASLTLCKGLRTLNLNGCRSIGDEGLKAISGLAQLQSLSLNGTDVSDHGLSWLGQCSSPVTFLSMRSCHRMTEKGIRALLVEDEGGEGSSCSISTIVKTLEALDISANSCLCDDVTRAIVRSGIRLSELWLRDCPLLTDLSVVLLAESTCGDTLRVLDLWGCKGVGVGSRNWLHKPHFPRLRWLGVAWTFNVQVAMHLKSTRPSLRIRRNGAEFNDQYGGDFVESPSKTEMQITDELEQWLDEDEDS